MTKKILSVTNKRIDTTPGNKRVFYVEKSEVGVHYDDDTYQTIGFAEVVREKQTRDSVAFLPVCYNEDGGIARIMLRHALRPVTKRDGVEYGPGSGMLIEAPAGTFEKDDPETKIGALQRAAAELYEECGFKHYWTLSVIETPLYTTPGMVGERMWLAFVDVSGLEPEAPNGDGSAMEQGCWCEWYTPSQLSTMISNGTLCDMKTISLLSHLAMRQKEA